MELLYILLVVKYSLNQKVKLKRMLKKLFFMLEKVFLKTNFAARKAEVLNSLIINTTAKANDTTDILQTFR